jgi:hypothetical protein
VGKTKKIFASAIFVLWLALAFWGVNPSSARSLGQTVPTEIPTTKVPTVEPTFITPNTTSSTATQTLTPTRTLTATVTSIPSGTLSLTETLIASSTATEVMQNVTETTIVSKPTEITTPTATPLAPGGFTRTRLFQFIVFVIVGGLILIGTIGLIIYVASNSKSQKPPTDTPPGLS